MQRPDAQRNRSRPGTYLRRGATAVAVVLVVSLLVARSIQAFPKPFNPDKVVWQTTPTLTINPPGLLTPHDTNVISYLAGQISQAGVPIRVVVQEVAEPPVNIGADANNRASFYPVESKKGAKDGLLMLVEIPATDHTQTKVAFVTGKNFFPNGGLTYDALMAIKYQRIDPKIAKNTIGPAIIDGLNWIAWTNQFESSPRIEPATWQDRVEQVIDVAIAPLLGLYALALIVMGARTRLATRRLAAQVHPAQDGLDIPPDSVHLGALARGQVDDPVMVGVMLQLVAQGAIAVDGNRWSASDLRLLDADRCLTDAQRQVYGLLERIADPETGRVSAAMLRQLPDLWSPLRRQMAAHFVSIGLFTPPVKPLHRQMRWLCIIGLILAAIMLVIATLSMARWGILAGMGLAVVAAVAWWWSGHQSLDTNAGRASVHSPDRYVPRNESEAIELTIYRWIVTLDLTPTRLLAGSGSAMSLAEESIRTAAARLNTAVLGWYAP